MRIFKLALLLLFLSATYFSNAQIKCGSDYLREKLRETDSRAVQKEQEMNERILKRIIQKQSVRFRTAGQVYTIPVVVHVISPNPDPGNTFITDQKIQDGIDHLNKAFANSGPFNTTNGVNTYIQFCLAKQDAFGNYTSGITRTSSSYSDLDQGIASQEQSIKNLVVSNNTTGQGYRYDPHLFINVFLVNEISNSVNGINLAGYAYMPTGSNHGAMPADGIINEARYFGSTIDYSKVHIHEFGHYLGLYHTFEGGCTNSNCQTDGDHICDTPPDNSDQAADCIYGVLPPNSCLTDELDTNVRNPFRATALGGKGEQRDMINNYMDYGYQSCQNAFTQGQADRMVSVLEVERLPLLSSNGCQSPCTNPLTVSFSASTTTVNIPGSITFTNTTTGNSAGYSWIWDFGDNTTSTLLTPPSKVYNSEGKYTIKLTATNTDVSCTRNYALDVNVICPLIADFTINGNSNSVIKMNSASSLTLASTVPGATQFQWLLNGQNITNATTQTYNLSLPQNTGIYEIGLKVYNGNCWSQVASKTVELGNVCRLANKRTAKWYFGDLAAVDFANGTPTVLNNSIMQAPEGSATMSDEQGNLLFYTNGKYLYGANHVLVSNTPLCPDPISTKSSTQSSIIIPQPNNENRYFVFSIPEQVLAKGLYCSTVEINSSFPYGVITSGPTNIYDKLLAEKLTATYSPDGKKVFVAIHEYNSPNIVVFKIDENGLDAINPIYNAVAYSHPGSSPTGFGYQGQMKFSPQGDKLAMVSPDNGIELYGFNSYTGTVTSSVPIFTQKLADPSNYYYGVEFSPNGSRLYVTSYFDLYQFDLTLPNTAIASSITSVGKFYDSNSKSLQLALDGKIYMPDVARHYLSVIQSPNTVGIDCGYNEMYIDVNPSNRSGVISYYGVPNFIVNYFNSDNSPSINGSECVLANSTSVNYNCSVSLKPSESIKWSLENTMPPSAIIKGSDNLPTVNLDFYGIGTARLKCEIYGLCGVSTSYKDIRISSQCGTGSCPNVNLGEDKFVCSGKSIPIGFLRETGVVYSWSPTAGLSDPTKSNPDASPASTTTYTLTATKNGCTKSKQITIEVRQSPSLSTSTSNGSNFICNGGSLTLTANPSAGVQPMSVWWPWNGGDRANQLTVTTGGLYTARVESDNGCYTDAEFNIKKDLSVNCPGDVCAGVNLPPVFYNMAGESYVGGWIKAGDASKTILTSITVEDDYYAVAIPTNVIPACTLEAATPCHIGVKQNPTVNAGNDQTICPGDSRTIGTAVVPGSSYSWSSVPAGFTSNLINPSVSPSVTTTYTLAITKDGCTKTDDVVITPSAPLVSLSTPNGASFICPGTPLTLTANVSGGVSPYTYAWSNGGSTNQISVTTAGTYSLTVTDANQCSTTVASSAIDKLVVACPQPVCPGSNPPLTVTNANGVVGTYKTGWYLASDPSTILTSITTAGDYYAVAFPTNVVPACTLRTTTPCHITFLSTPATYTLTGNGPTGFCNNIDTRIISVSNPDANLGYANPISSVWSNGTIYPTNSTMTVTQSGYYTMTTTDQTTGCHTKSGGISFFSPDVEIQRVCNGTSSISLIPNSNVIASNYQWNLIGTSNQRTPITPNADGSITVSTAGLYEVSNDAMRQCGMTETTYEAMQLTSSDHTEKINGNFEGESVACTPRSFFTDYTCNDQFPNNIAGDPIIDFSALPGHYMINNDNVQNVSAWNTQSGTALWSGSAMSTTTPTYMVVDGLDAAQDQLIWGKDYLAVDGQNYFIRANIRNIDAFAPGNTLEIPEVVLRAKFFNGATLVKTEYLDNQVLVNGSKWIELSGVAYAGITSNVSYPLTLVNRIQVELLMRGGGSLGRDIGVDEISMIPFGICENLNTILTSSQKRSAVAFADIEQETIITCRNAPVTFRAINYSDATINYAWSKKVNGTLQLIQQGTTLNTVTVTTDQSADYELLMTDPSGNTLRKQLKVTVIDPTLQITSTSDNLCQTNPITYSVVGFSGIGNIGYKWYSGGIEIPGATGSTMTLSNVAGSAPIKCELVNQCQNVNGTPMKVYSNDIITKGPYYSPGFLGPDIVRCSNQSIAISAPYANVTSYVWNAGQRMSSIPVGAAGIYGVSITDVNGCVTYDEVVVTDKPAPSVTSMSVSPSTTVCAGTLIQITPTYSGGVSPFTFDWKDNGTVIATVSSLMTNPSSTKTYVFTVYGSNGCSASSSQQITVNPAPNIGITVVPSTICTGGSSTLTMSATGGTSPYSYAWKQASTLISTNPGINVAPASTTSYNATVTDSKGCVKTANAITVTVAAGTPLSLGTISITNICAGSPISVPYTVASCATYNSGNVFTAQLSNSTGSFSSPVNIGTLTATTSGTINATIPSNTAAGTGYRIRVVSSNMAYTSASNGDNITVSVNCGLSFDGTDDRAIVPANSNYVLGNENFTMEFWIKTSNTAMRPILSNRLSGNYTGSFMLDTYNNGTSLLMQVNGSNWISPSFPTIANGVCHHIALVRSGTTLTYYIDGVSIGTAGFNISASAMNNLTIGYDAYGNTSFSGSISEVRFWKVARTAAEISSNMSAVLPGSTANLKGYWRFKEASGEALIDESSVLNNGYLGTNATASDAQNPSRVGTNCYSGDKVDVTYESSEELLDSSDYFTDVYIYPNPFAHETNIMVKGEAGGKVLVRVTDINGREMSKLEVLNNVPSPLGDELPTGVYIVEVTGDNKRTVHKVVKTE